jgi:hypothetical protein
MSSLEDKNTDMIGDGAKATKHFQEKRKSFCSPHILSQWCYQLLLEVAMFH